MDTTRILHGYCMDTTRILHGYCTDTTLILHGYYSDTARILHGYCSDKKLWERQLSVNALSSLQRYVKREANKVGSLEMLLNKQQLYDTSQKLDINCGTGFLRSFSFCCSGWLFLLLWLTLFVALVDHNYRLPRLFRINSILSLAPANL